MKKTPISLYLNSTLTYDYTCAKCNCKHKIVELTLKDISIKKVEFEIEEIDLKNLINCPILVVK